MFYIRSKVFRWANFRRAKIQTVFLKEGVKTRSWKLEAAIKRVDSIDSNCRNAYTREGRENYEQRSGCYTTRATKATWKVYVHMYARSSNCQLNDAKHMDYFVATTLFRDAPRFVFDDSKRSRASELSKSLARSSWHGKNHYSPRVVTEVSSWLRKMSMPLRPL